MGDRRQADEFYKAAIAAHGDASNPDHLKLSYGLFGSACMADPTWPEAFYQAGNNNSDLGILPAAIACWRRALECEPDTQLRARVLVNLAWRLGNLARLDEAIELCEEAVRLDSNLHLGWVNLSCLYQVAPRRDDMLRCARLGY